MRSMQTKVRDKGRFQNKEVLMLKNRLNGAFTGFSYLVALAFSLPFLPGNTINKYIIAFNTRKRIQYSF
ncbi:MAG: hypothetical protein ACXVBK_14635 [Flavisolibacter sp.]